MPHEEPQRTNPPGGVVAYYWLKSPAMQPLKLDVVDAGGVVRASAASDTPVRPVDTETLNVQAYWEQSAPPLSVAAGMHRFALGGAPGRGAGGFGRRGAAGLKPGEYTLRLVVDGKTYTRHVILKPDPRGAREGGNDSLGDDDDDK